MQCFNYRCMPTLATGYIPATPALAPGHSPNYVQRLPPIFRKIRPLAVCTVHIRHMYHKAKGRSLLRTTRAKYWHVETYAGYWDVYGCLCKTHLCSPMFYVTSCQIIAQARIRRTGIAVDPGHTMIPYTCMWLKVDESCLCCASLAGSENPICQSSPPLWSATTSKFLALKN